MNAARLFPTAGFRFRLGIRSGNAADFFRPRDPTGNLLAERNRWLETAPYRHARLDPEGVPLLAEFSTLVTNWGVVGAELREASVEELGRRLEPDFLLLSPGSTGRFHLRGGSLCFPTGWSLEEKIGKPIDAIHGDVPGLNASLGPAVDRVLGRLKPGQSWERENWGLAATDELNLHPALERPAPNPPVDLEKLWLRVEEQVLVGLPAASGVAFGIRIVLTRLDTALGDVGLAPGLLRALETMPAEVAAYKRLDAIREPLVDLLRQRS